MEGGYGNDNNINKRNDADNKGITLIVITVMMKMAIILKTFPIITKLVMIIRLSVITVSIWIKYFSRNNYVKTSAAAKTIMITILLMVLFLLPLILVITVMMKMIVLVMIEVVEVLVVVIQTTTKQL